MYTAMDEFSTWVTTELRARNWTFAELARRSKLLSPQNVSAVLRGDRNPSLEFCKGLAEAFTMRPEEVLYHADLLPAPLAPVHGEEQVVRFFRCLSAQARNYILTTLAALAGQNRSVIADRRAEYQTELGYTPGDQLAQQIELELALMPIEEQDSFWNIITEKREKRKNAKET